MRLSEKAFIAVGFACMLYIVFGIFSGSANATHQIEVIEGTRYQTKLVALCDNGNSISNMTDAVQQAEGMSGRIATDIATQNGCTFEPISFKLTEYLCSIKRKGEFKMSVAKVTLLSNNKEYYMLGILLPTTPTQCNIETLKVLPLLKGEKI